MISIKRFLVFYQEFMFGRTIFSLLFPVLLLLMASACGGEEKPLTDIPGPDPQIVEIRMDGTASVFYSLKRHDIVRSAALKDWDLRLCAQSDKFYFYLNTAKHMRITRHTGSFSDQIPVSALSWWHSDLVKNGRILTAMGSWGDFSFADPQSFGYTYIVDLGYIGYPGEFGYRKIQVLGCTDQVYRLRYGTLSDPVGDTISIPKNTGYNNMYFSFADGGKQVVVEPPASDWDLEFTWFGLNTLVPRDSATFDTTRSLTDMVLLNTDRRLIFGDTIKPFEKITFWDAENYPYVSPVDYIGNRWRYYDPVQKKFLPVPGRVYVLKCPGNHLYKLEFLSVDKSVAGITRIGFRLQNM